jgi:YVTN family beta-propeller protein
MSVGSGNFLGRHAAALAAFACLCSLAHAGPMAYVPNEGSGSVSVIDTDRDVVVGEIRAGAKPRGIAASRDGARLYVSDQPANALVVIDTAKRAIEGSIALGESPEGVSLSPDGKLIAAASEVTNAVVLVDVASG